MRARTAALLALAALPPTLEATLVAATGFQAARGLAPQASAVWPYQSYHDLRWLLVYHNSFGGFALELLAVIVVRGLFDAGLVALAWPAHLARPSLRWLTMRNIEIIALSAVIVSPWAALSVAAGTYGLSWYLFFSVIPMLVLSPFLVRGGVVAHWWRGLPSLELVGWALLNVALVTVAGALAASMSGWWGVPVAALAGAANGLLRRQTVAEAESALARRMRWPRVPVAPLAIILTMVGAVGVQGLIGIAAGNQGQWRPFVATQPLSDRIKYAVIAIGGHESRYDGQPAVDPVVEFFSYQGLDPHGRPLPYEPVATQRSLESSAAILATQVSALHRRTGRPVALLGFSEGAMVARTYLEKWPRSAVEVVMLFSPLVRPARAYYPPPTERSGWGVVTGWELRGIAGMANVFRQHKTSPDEPFVRSLIDNAPFYRARVLCPVPGVRMIAFLPTVAAAEAPPGEYSRIPVFQLPAFHGGLLGRAVVQDRAVMFLTGETVNEPRREYGLLQRLGAAWQAPPLAFSVNPKWAGTGQPDPAFTGEVC